MSKVHQLLQQVRNEMGSDYAASFVIGMDGLSIASDSMDVIADETAATARSAMIIKLAKKVSEKLGLGTVVDHLVTNNQLYILYRLLGDGSYCWVLVSPKDATLGSVRMTMNEYAPQIWDAIPR